MRSAFILTLPPLDEVREKERGQLEQRTPMPKVQPAEASTSRLVGEESAKKDTGANEGVIYPRRGKGKRNNAPLDETLHKGDLHRTSEAI